MLNEFLRHHLWMLKEKQTNNNNIDFLDHFYGFNQNKSLVNTNKKLISCITSLEKFSPQVDKKICLFIFISYLLAIDQINLPCALATGLLDLNYHPDIVAYLLMTVHRSYQRYSINK